MLQVRHYYSIVSLPTVHKEAAEVVSWLSLWEIRMAFRLLARPGVSNPLNQRKLMDRNSAEFSTAAASQQQTRRRIYQGGTLLLNQFQRSFQSVPLADPQWYITLIAFQYRRLLPNRMSIYHPIACFYVGFALRGGEGGIRCSNGSTYLILPACRTDSHSFEALSWRCSLGKKGLREHVPPKASAVGRAVPKGAGNRAELLRRQDLSSRRRMWLFFPGALSTAMQSTALMGIPIGHLWFFLFDCLSFYELISDNLRTIFGSTVSSCCNDTQLRQDQLIKKILLYSTRAKHKTIPATQPCKK
eukprot:gene699-379_t